MNLCPRCNIALELIEIEGEKALMCKQCEGLMLRKLDHLMGLSEQQLLESEASEALFADHPQVDVTGTVACPICTQPMRRYVYSTDSGVTVDCCQSGHGIWLDDGELAKIYDYVNDKGRRPA
ncbi:zf-TFIIB domain-containing protein [bacterium]|nr:zf-TFIIB domain-containing protein [bacterium]